MAGSRRNVTIGLNLDDKGAQRELKKLAREADNTADAMDDVESAGKAMARAIEQSADSMIDEIDATRRAVDALERELDGVDIDATAAVSDLKRMGLTAQDVEADAEQLAAALRRAGDVELHAARKGFDDVGDAVTGVRERTERANDASRGFYGNVVGDSADAAFGVSGLGESVSQLTEGVLEGEVGFKSLLGAGLGMGAVAVVFKQIQSAKEQMAAVRAFEADQVQEYVDALEDAESSLAGIADKLRDARGVELVDLFSGDTKDITSDLVALNLTVDDFAQLVEGGQAGVEEWADAMRDAGVKGSSLDNVIMAASQQAYTFAEATKVNADKLKVFGEEADEAAQSAEDHADAMNDARDAARDEAEALQESADALIEQIDARRSAADATYALRDAGDDWRETLENVSDKLQEAGDDQRAVNRVLSDAREKATRLADGLLDVATEQAAANGETLTAKQSIEIWNRAMLDAAADASGPVRDEILNYIDTVEGIPSDKATAIRAAVARGDLYEANRLLNDASRTRGSAIVAAAWTADAERALNLTARDRYAYVFLRQGNRPGGRAAGVMQAPPGLSWVGEQGPELVDFRGGERVHDAQKSKQMVRGNAITVHNHFPPGTRPSEIAVALRTYDRIQGPRQ